MSIFFKVDMDLFTNKIPIENVSTYIFNEYFLNSCIRQNLSLFSKKQNRY